jgi:arsenite methyltransferase
MTDNLVEQVQSKYGAAAASGLSGDQAGVRAVAEAFGYTPEELASVPADSNLGLSCGNPTASASLRAGEVVVDLGCGGGLDVFLAARRVGPAGKAIGIDMTPQMIERARRNAAMQALTNVEFHLAAIDALPLPNDAVDCIISNCVINLAPDKRKVFGEMHRVLKPGGRIAVSDIAIKKPLPDDLARSMMAYIGCIAGAIAIADYERGLRDAGFHAVQVVDTRKDLNAYAQVDNQAACCAPTMSCCNEGEPNTSEIHQALTVLLEKYDINDYAASVQVYALKKSG